MIITSKNIAIFKDFLGMISLTPSTEPVNFQTEHGGFYQNCEIRGPRGS